MSKLSPAAQAVWDAFNEDEVGVFVDYGDKLAAAIEAIVNNDAESHYFPALGKQQVVFVDKLLSITRELKGYDN